MSDSTMLTFPTYLAGLGVIRLFSMDDTTYVGVMISPDENGELPILPECSTDGFWKFVPEESDKFYRVYTLCN